MGDTSIRCSEELLDALYERKNRGESYEDVIWRLLEATEDSGGDEGKCSEGDESEEGEEEAQSE